LGSQVDEHTVDGTRPSATAERHHERRERAALAQEPCCETAPSPPDPTRGGAAPTEITYRGTADPLVPYDGGASTPPNNSSITVHFLGAVGTFQKFAQFDGCTGMPTASDCNGCQSYTQCTAGTEVTLCTVQGGGHAPVEWAMLKSHPMP